MRKTLLRWPLLAALLIALLISSPRLLVRAFAAPSAAASGIKVELNVEGVAPREVEDTTQAAITRDYSQAWRSMEASLSHNRAEGLGDIFTGTALDNLQQRLDEQRKNGLSTRYVDRGHKLQAIFYSPDGSSMELHDVAQVEIQTAYKGNVIESQPATIHYVTLMTAGADHWKVRLLQATPGF